MKTFKEEKEKCLQQCRHGSQAPGCCLGKILLSIAIFPVIAINICHHCQHCHHCWYCNHCHHVSKGSHVYHLCPLRSGCWRVQWQRWRCQSGCPALSPPASLGRSRTNFHSSYLNMYQQDCECHKAGQDIVLNFEHHTKLAKLHPSSSKVFLQLIFLHTLSLDLYNWLSTICICFLP